MAMDREKWVGRNSQRVVAERGGGGEEEGEEEEEEGEEEEGEEEEGGGEEEGEEEGGEEEISCNLNLLLLTWAFRLRKRNIWKNNSNGVTEN